MEKDIYSGRETVIDGQIGGRTDIDEGRLYIPSSASRRGCGGIKRSKTQSTVLQMMSKFELDLYFTTHYRSVNFD